MLTKTYQWPYEVVYDSCLQALKECGHSISEKIKKEGKITAETSGSIRSWGEILNISIKDRTVSDPILMGRCKVELTVESRSPNQLFSWGKNDANETQIISSINKILN